MVSVSSGSRDHGQGRAGGVPGEAIPDDMAQQHQLLAADIEAVFAPEKDHYSAPEAKQWVVRAKPLVDTLERCARDEPCREVVSLIERAMVLTDETYSRLDRCVDAPRGLMRTLIQAHAAAVLALEPPLNAEEQSRLVRLLYALNFADSPHYLNLDMAVYGPVLGEEAVDEFAALCGDKHFRRFGAGPLEQITAGRGQADKLEQMARSYAEDDFAMLELIGLLVKAGHAERAVEVGWEELEAQRLRCPVSSRAQGLVHALCAAGREDEVFEAWARAVELSPTRSMLEALLHYAAGCSGQQRAHANRFIEHVAEPALAEHDPQTYVSHLLSAGRRDEAWEFAQGQQLEDRAWHALAAARAKTHPLQALGVYEKLAWNLLSSYGQFLPKDARFGRSVRDLLLEMRDVAISGGDAAIDRYEEFVSQFAAQCTRHHRIMVELSNAGLLSRLER